MNFKEVLSIKHRREKFGGIIFIPSYNSQLAVNSDFLELLKIIQKKESIIETQKLVSKKYNIGIKESSKLISFIISDINSYLNEYKENKDSLSDWSKNNGISSIKLSSPIMLIIEITKKCNMKCAFCCQELDKNVGPELSMSEWKKIIDEARSLNVFKIHYMGGDPLLRNDFFEIIDYTSKQGIYLSFTTNGTLFNESMSSKLRKIENLLPVQVSVHGESNKSCDFYRIREEDWEKSINCINLLRKAKIPFGIKTVISRLNYKNIYNISSFLAEKEAKTITFLHLLPIGAGEKMEKDCKFSKKEILEIVRQIEKSKTNFPSVHFDYRPFLNTYFPRKAKTELDEYIKCPAGSLDMRIRADGKVLQCSSIRVPIDDVKNKSLKNIWGGLLGKMSPCPHHCKDIFEPIQIY